MKVLTVAVAVIAVLAAGIGPAGASHAERRCRTPWSSLADHGHAEGTGARLVDVRAGSHRCFDRLVLDLDGPAPAFTVAYVDQLIQDGSGHVVDVDGGALLEIRVVAPAYDVDTGRPIYDPSDDDEIVDVDGHPTLRQAVFAGSFEGQSLVGLGVRARLPFRAFTIDRPGDSSRLVVDVAHRW